MPLTLQDKYILNYAIYCYGGKYKIENQCLRMWCGPDEFYLRLDDCARFGFYTLVHRNTCRKKHFHTQAKCNNLHYAIFLAYTHHIGKTNNLPNNTEDYHYFVSDAMLYKMEE